MKEPGRLQSMGSLRVRHDWVTSLSLFAFMHWRRKWQPTPVFLPAKFRGQRNLAVYSAWVSKCWTWLNTQHTYKCHPRYSLPLVRGLCQLENHPWHIPELKLLLVLSDSGFREPNESQYLFCQEFPKLYPFSLLACYNLWITYDSNAIFTLRVYCS